MKLLSFIIFLAFIGCTSKNEELSAEPDASKWETGAAAGTVDVGTGEPPKAGTGEPLQLAGTADAGAAGAGATDGANVYGPPLPDGTGTKGFSLGGRSGPPPLGRVNPPLRGGADSGTADAGAAGAEVTGGVDVHGPLLPVVAETQGLHLSDEVGTKDTADKKLVCKFPGSLKKAVEEHLKMRCADITEDHLAGIKELRVKYIFEEDLPLLSKDYAAYFTGLEKLDISKNLYMNVLPSFVTHLPSLKELNVSQTGISDFNEDICKLENLTTLIAHRNSYKNQEVPMNIFCLSRLKVLDMSYSSIRYIDEYISKLENLEELYMRDNELMTLPFMLHLLPKLVLVDFRKNEFVPWDFYVYSTGADNILYDCKKYSNSEEREECREEMRANFKCNWIEKIPFQRGLPFRQYKALEDMTSAERDTFERSKPQPSKNRCYSFWFNNTFRLLPEEEKEALREKTINGKTVREWRLVYSERGKYSIWREYGLSVCEQIIIHSDTVHLPDHQEIFPELYYSPKWTEPPKEECVVKREEKND